MNKKGNYFSPRDRFGIKPLYYVKQSGLLLIASELKALLSSEFVSEELNEQAESIFLRRGSVPSPFPSYRAGLFNRYSLLTRWFPKNRFSRNYLKSDFDHNVIADIDWVSGACLLHRRELIKRPGLLDEKFFMYCEDVDYCFRAKQEGWSVRYHPGASVLHHIAGSSKQLPRKAILERHKSIWHYYTKHFKRNIAKDIAVGAGILGRCAMLLVLNRLK